MFATKHTLMTILARQAGTLADNASSLSDPIVWDDSVGAQYDPNDVTIITVTTTVEMLFTSREAASVDELTTPFGGIHHEITQTIPANSTRRLIVGQDDSLAVGWGWLTNNSGGSGDYSITGCRRKVV